MTSLKSKIVLVASVHSLPPHFRRFDMWVNVGSIWGRFRVLCKVDVWSIYWVNPASMRGRHSAHVGKL